MKFVIGKKLGMTTLFDGEKGALNVTLISVTENTVSAVRTVGTDGYSAVQVTTEKTSNRDAVTEFRVDKYFKEETVSAVLAANPVGTVVTLEAFKVGDKVNVTGITKGKGFQGVVKRHGFAGGRGSHGGKHDLRKPGSIGATFPEHVVKGRRMAGRMGADQFTVQNLKVEYVDVVGGIIGVKGAVPGVAGRIVKVYSTR